MKDWLMDVLVAASTIWECASEDVEKAMAQYCFPALQRSPAGKSEESGMGGVEAMIIIAGQMNRNGYSGKSDMRVYVWREIGHG
jgi:hypothetical protein